MRVLDCYLALRIWAEEGYVAIASGERCCAGQSVCNRDWERHQLFGLVDRVSDHYPLIACALVQACAANRRAYIWRLLVNIDADICALCVEVVLRLGVADVGDDRPRQRFVVDVRLGRDFSVQPHAVGGARSLARDARRRVVAQCRVDYCIRDLVADLVWMTVRNRFRRQQVVCWVHQVPDSQELRYLNCAGVSSSNAIPIDLSLSAAMSLSISSGNV